MTVLPKHEELQVSSTETATGRMSYGLERNSRLKLFMA